MVRTQNDPGTSPQFNYLPPHVALDPHLEDLLTMRRKQLLDVLEQTGDATYPELALAMIQELDFERGFYILQHSMGYLTEIGEWEDTVAAFESKHGALAEGISETLAECVHRDGIKNMRSAIADPEHRFFLALLMNVRTRTDLLTLVSQRFPEQPAGESILRWAGEFADMAEDGISILDAQFPETIDIPEEDQASLFQEALRYFLVGGKKIPATLKKLPPGDLQDLRDAFTNSSLRILTAV